MSNISADVDLSEDQLQDPQNEEIPEEEPSVKINSFELQLNDKAADESFANSEEQRRHEFRIMIEELN